MRIAFLGLGTMGAPMATRLVAGGHDVVVWNRTAARAATFVVENPSARAATTVRAAVADRDCAITMLADPAALRSVFEEALPWLTDGALFLDMSTVDPATSRSLGAEASARGVRFLDAPVSGSRQPAVDGKLLVLAGGDAADLERARPVLACLGTIRHVGPVGAGSATKLVLNGLGAHMMTGFCSMMAFAAAQGLDARTTLEVIQAGAFSSPLYAGKMPRLLAHDFTADFRLALMRKDQQLVLDTAAHVGAHLPSLTAILGVLDEAIAAGLGEQDLSVLARFFEDKAGTTIR